MKSSSFCVTTLTSLKDPWVNVPFLHQTRTHPGLKFSNIHDFAQKISLWGSAARLTWALYTAVLESSEQHFKRETQQNWGGLIVSFLCGIQKKCSDFDPNRQPLWNATATSVRLGRLVLCCATGRRELCRISPNCFTLFCSARQVVPNSFLSFTWTEAFWAEGLWFSPLTLQGSERWAARSPSSFVFKVKMVLFWIDHATKNNIFKQLGEDLWCSLLSLKGVG